MPVKERDTSRFADVPRTALRLEEAAYSTGLSVVTIRNLCRSNGFPAFQVGERWVIPVNDLQAWMTKMVAARNGGASA